MADHPCVVKIEDGLDTGYSRLNALRAAGEAGEKMWLNKSRDDFEIRFDVGFVEIDFRPIAVSSHVRQLLRSEGIVIFYFDRIGDFSSEHGNQLVASVGAMRTNSVDDHKIFLRHMFQF